MFLCAGGVMVSAPETTISTNYNEGVLVLAIARLVAVLASCRSTLGDVAPK